MGAWSRPTAREAAMVGGRQLWVLSCTSEDPQACPPPGKWECGQGRESQLLLP